jgi:hypothetical protein
MDLRLTKSKPSLVSHITRDDKAHFKNGKSPNLLLTATADGKWNLG